MRCSGKACDLRPGLRELNVSFRFRGLVVIDRPAGAHPLQVLNAIALGGVLADPDASIEPDA